MPGGPLRFRSERGRPVFFVVGTWGRGACRAAVTKEKQTGFTVA